MQQISFASDTESGYLKLVEDMDLARFVGLLFEACKNVWVDNSFFFVGHNGLCNFWSTLAIFFDLVERVLIWWMKMIAIKIFF